MVSTDYSPSPASRRLRLALPALTLTLAAGCASVPNPTPGDPLESYNRSMFQFNETVDDYVFKPVVQGYEFVAPKPVRTCISNIFNNVGDVFSALHSFLQGRGHDAVNSFGRVLFNSTMGLGGCIDVASMNGVPRIPNDLGVTLGVWGFDSGPYIVLPFLGSSSVRDGVATGVGMVADLSTSGAIFTIDNVPVRNSILGLYAVDLRANLMYADDLVDRIALDRYSFIRDAYLQRREAMVKGEFGGQGNTTSDDVPIYEDYGDDDNDAPVAPANP